MGINPTVGPIIGCQDLWVTHAGAKRHEPTHALRGVTMTAAPGEMVSVVGPSGSGKSSLLHALSGFVKPSQGVVHLLGQDVTRASQSAVARLHRRGVGFVFQSLNLVPSMPVIENVMLPAAFAGAEPNRQYATDLLAYLGLSHCARQRTSELSGGEQQRVAVARVLYTNPQVVMADEPTGALDSRSGGVVLDCLRDLTRRGASVLLVTHDLRAAARADRAIVMRDGRLVREVVAPRSQDLAASDDDDSEPVADPTGPAVAHV